jgi:hypothetical protein
MKIYDALARVGSGLIITTKSAAAEELSKSKFMDACREVAKEDDMDEEETKIACDKAWEEYQAENE